MKTTETSKRFAMPESGSSSGASSGDGRCRNRAISLALPDELAFAPCGTLWSDFGQNVFGDIALFTNALIHPAEANAGHNIGESSGGQTNDGRGKRDHHLTRHGFQ